MLPADWRPHLSHAGQDDDSPEISFFSIWCNWVFFVVYQNNTPQELSISCCQLFLLLGRHVGATAAHVVRSDGTRTAPKHTRQTARDRGFCARISSATAFFWGVRLLVALSEHRRLVHVGDCHQEMMSHASGFTEATALMSVLIRTLFTLFSTWRRLSRNFDACTRRWQKVSLVHGGGRPRTLLRPGRRTCWKSTTLFAVNTTPTRTRADAHFYRADTTVHNSHIDPHFSNAMHTTLAQGRRNPCQHFFTTISSH